MFRKVIIFFIIVSIMFNVDIVSADMGVDEEIFISKEVYDALEVNDSCCVSIWLEDIDIEEIYRNISCEYDLNWKMLECREQSLIASNIKKNNGFNYTDLMDQEEWKEIIYDVDKLVDLERKLASEMYVINNTCFTDTYDIGKNVVFLSHYAPFLIVNVNRSQLDMIKKDIRVNEITLTPVLEIDRDDSNGQNVTATTSTSYRSYLNIDPLLYGVGLSGNGVKVGIIEADTVYSTSDPELGSSNITQLSSGTAGEHAKSIAKIICGSNGIAHGANVYAIKYTDSTNFYTNIETLLTNGVKIINCSQGFGRSVSQWYTDMEKWIDHISTNHNALFIKSAGNTSGYVNIPGQAYNALTVGNVNYMTGALVANSGYICPGGCNKPDLVSAGENVLCGGTSAATATITGIAALLYEVRPTLTSAPYATKAILMASCNRMVSGGTLMSGYTNNAGAGIVNAYVAYLIVRDSQFKKDYIGSDVSKAYSCTALSCGSSFQTFALSGNKMNICTSSHASTAISNINMPGLKLVVKQPTGTILGTDGFSNDARALVRNSIILSQFLVEVCTQNTPSRGVSFAVAWY